ncbi:hypothetical protein ACFWPU_15060 [Streptomyces sp. NPDC058471]|uniref:hypothetical protein n=1 Tax=Streptomyces sp. NPDC058471 TaxID=3346516 RepID=UPI003660706C
MTNEPPTPLTRRAPLQRSAFVMRLDDGMLEYFGEIVDAAVTRFGISRAEAVARVNERYGHLEISPYQDLMGHEMPEFWAYGLYYKPDAQGRRPTGDEESDAVIDFTALERWPAPPPDSPAWTYASGDQPPPDPLPRQQT